jgi:hypothetical protein
MVTKPRLSKLPAEKILKLSLWEPFNTPLHRAGLAGLYMALKHLAPHQGCLIDWKLASESMGIIKLPVLGSISTDTAIAIHKGILNTFLQHPSSVESAGVKSRLLELDEDKTIEVKYKALTSYNYQNLKFYKDQELNCLPSNNKKKQDTRKRLYDSHGCFEPDN